MGVDLFEGAQILGPAISRIVLLSAKKRKRREPDGRAYQQTLEMMRKLFFVISFNTVEDIQHVTTAWIPHPPSCIISEVSIPESFYPNAARLISESLREENLERVGRTWWQWRRPGSVVMAEWVEMKRDYSERMENSGECKKVIFYVHGGAYFLGGIGHGPQIQRHARKLKGRAFAPRYRLAPQFPFPCALQDVLSAYLYLQTLQDPSTIIVAGDSAGAGLVLSLLLILRDHGFSLPAGASLISPWVDLTHSFPSITIPTKWDYVPSHGFHGKPCLSWPPPNSDEIKALNLPTPTNAEPDYEVMIDGEVVALKDQVEMYAPNLHLQMPLISGVLAASLGGLCPLQVISGGGEVLRDEQIYLAHKAAHPTTYFPSPEILARNGDTKEDIEKYPPTDVQLLVFDDCPHAAPTLGHTWGAKLEFRAVSQFAAWALGRAQGVDMDQYVGRPGDPLLEFEDHMIRRYVDRDGRLRPMEPAEEIRACTFPNEEIGMPKVEALKGWFKYREEINVKFHAEKEKVHQQRVKDIAIGYVKLPNGEIPPPSALVGRLVIGQEVEAEKERGRLGKRLFGGIFGKLYQDGRSDAREPLKSKHLAFTTA